MFSVLVEGLVANELNEAQLGFLLLHPRAHPEPRISPRMGLGDEAVSPASDRVAGIASLGPFAAIQLPQPVASGSPVVLLANIFRPDEIDLAP